MSTQYIRSHVGMGKIAIIVLGIIVLGVGLHSHFQSGWAKNDVHKVCGGYNFAGITCPSFSLEQYYVAMIIVCFILSIGSLVASIMSDTATGNLKLVDLVYHGASALLLFIAAIVYIISAEQIHKYVARDGPYVKFRRSEKLAAGALTIIQAVLYGAVGFFIARN